MAEDTSNKTSLPSPGTPIDVAPDLRPYIVQTLNGYKREAMTNRATGLNPRDPKWEQNTNLYWNRYDFSNKADWQAKETMPEVPAYVDRFAAALKEALVAVPDGFYTIEDPYDTEHDMTDAIKRLTDAWLSTSGRNQVGHTLAFPSVFEEQVKLGAIKAMASVTTWKEDVPGGRVAIETMDPSFVWLDHTYRNLYRVRRVEIDTHDLQKMARMKSTTGQPLFDLEQLDQCVTAQVAAAAFDDTQRKMQQTGTGQEISSNRRPIYLDEYVATVIGPDGKVIGEDNSLYLVANEQYLFRGPEKNPFWHGKDWLIYAPMVTAPLSVYGRSYMEDFGSVATTFTNLTNLILDAVQTSALNAFALVPAALENPEQARSGVGPNKTFLLNDGYRPEDFAKKLELGRLDDGAVKVWEALKQELSEAAGMNEIAMGQFAPNSRTSATEVSETQSSSSAVIRSLAQTVETRWLDPQLDLVWKTGLQHFRANDPRVIAAVGEEMASAIALRRKEFVTRPMTFQARGITTMIQKSRAFQSLMQLLQVISQSQELLAAFMQKVDPEKFLAYLFNLSGIDPNKLGRSAREQLTKQVMQPMMGAAAAAPQPSPAASAAMGQATTAMGIGA